MAVHLYGTLESSADKINFAGRWGEGTIVKHLLYKQEELSSTPQILDESQAGAHVWDTCFFVARLKVEMEFPEAPRPVSLAYEEQTRWKVKMDI